MANKSTLNSISSVGAVCAVCACAVCGCQANWFVHFFEGLSK